MSNIYWVLPFTRSTESFTTCVAGTLICSNVYELLLRTSEQVFYIDTLGLQLCHIHSHCTQYKSASVLNTVNRWLEPKQVTIFLQNCLGKIPTRLSVENKFSFKAKMPFTKWIFHVHPTAYNYIGNKCKEIVKFYYNYFRHICRHFKFKVFTCDSH